MAFSREEIRARADGRCEYCRLPEAFSGAAFHIEHIVPRSRGGSHAAGNVALSCPMCNGQKGSRVRAADPRTGRQERLFHPRRDAWTRHFAWSGNRLTIEGRTTIGRATVAALSLNSLARQAFRRIWRDRLMDLFPF